MREQSGSGLSGHTGFWLFSQFISDINERDFVSYRLPVVPNTKTRVFALQKAVHNSVRVDSLAVALFLSHPFCLWLSKNHWEPVGIFWNL